ncbi:MAG: hypothetical protein RLZZ494_2118 [Pseudomonadota bacterium]|jgi:Mor family transcriptional regulator
MPESALLTPEQRRPLEGLLPLEYPERLREMALELYAELLELMPDNPGGPAWLAWVAFSQTERVSTALGGGNFYMHKARHFRLTKRDREMMAKYNGRNVPQLAREYGLTETRVRQIVDAWYKEYTAKRQPPLIADDA